MNRRNFGRQTITCLTVVATAPVALSAPQQAPVSWIKRPDLHIGSEYQLKTGDTIKLVAADRLHADQRLAQWSLTFSTQNPLTEGIYHLAATANRQEFELFLQPKGLVSMAYTCCLA